MDLVILLIVVGAIIVIAAMIFGLYNGLVRRRIRVDEAWAQIDVQLRRRHDLIPNLVNSVRGYMEHEQEVLTRVTEARANAVAAGAEGPAEAAQAENGLTQTLRSLFAVMENYPDLKANQNVLALQEELSTTENQISFSRQHYNASVRDYNTAISTVPAVFVAGMLGFTSRQFFETEPESREAPEVRLRA
jgi:LemA protein